MFLLNVSKKYKFLLFLLYSLCYTEKNKTRTSWAWKLSKNKSIESHQNITLSYFKKCIIISNATSSVHIWIGNHPLVDSVSISQDK